MNELFWFSEITSEEILSEINKLGNKKVGSYKNIPTKILKVYSEISCEYLTKNMEWASNHAKKFSQMN